MATLFLPLALVSFIFMILSGHIMDKIKHWHVILALSSLASSGAFVFLYFATNYYQVLIPYLIISVGCSMFVNMVTVGIFRAFNVDGPVILPICDVMIFVMCTLTPQIIRWCSVEREDGIIDYQNAMYIFSGVAIIIAILLLCIPSPQRSQLVQDVEKIKNGLIEEKHNDVDLQETYTVSLFASPTMRRMRSAFYAKQIPSLRRLALVTELDAVQEECDALSVPTMHKKAQTQRNSITLDEEQFILDNWRNLFAVTIEHCKLEQDQAKTEHNKGEDDPEQKSDHAPYSFVAIAVAVDYLKAFNRYIYLSFITTFVKHVHGLSTSDGLDLISTLFTGVLVGQCLTTFLIKAFKPHDIALVFSILTLFGAICFVAAIYIEQNVLLILHIVSVFNGFGSAPLYSVTLASLCSIQPLTGRLSAIYHSADIIASFSPSIAGVLITHFGVEIGLNYLHLLVSILMFILFAINKVQYDNFKKDHVEDGEDIKSTNVAETVGISDS
eukprot:197652_1